MRCEKKGVFSLTGKNFLKGVGTYFFAEILCLFLALTLSAVGGAVTRVISAVCTAAVLICLCINFAVNRGKEDKKREIPNRIGRRFFWSISVSALFLLLGICLLLSRCAVLPDGFYRWYKIFDAPFLQLCNFFSRDVMTHTLSWGAAVFLAVLNFLPFAVTWVTYDLTRKGFVPEELIYERKK